MIIFCKRYLHNEPTKIEIIFKTTNIKFMPNIIRWQFTVYFNIKETIFNQRLVKLKKKPFWVWRTWGDISRNNLSQMICLPLFQPPLNPFPLLCFLHHFSSFCIYLQQMAVPWLDSNWKKKTWIQYSPSHGWIEISKTQRNSNKLYIFTRLNSKLWRKRKKSKRLKLDLVEGARNRVGICSTRNLEIFRAEKPIIFTIKLLV